MSKLLQLHDKVKYHRYRDDIVANAAHYKRYVRLFNDLLDAFQEEINAAKRTLPADRNSGMKMLIEADNRCFMIDARHKLNCLSELGDTYYRTDSYAAQQQIRILMAQLEGTLSSIHEYTVSGRITFMLRYPTDDTMEAVRLVWRGTDYAAQ